MSQKTENLKFSLREGGYAYMIKEYPLPRGWRWVMLSKVCDVFSGSSAPQEKKYFNNGKYPFVRVQDLGRQRRTANLVDIKDYINDIAIKELNLVKAKKGTILFPKSGAAITTNNRAILGIDAFIVSHLAALKAREGIVDNYFVYYWLCFIDMVQYMENSGYPSLKLSIISKIHIPLPPLHEQKLIVGKIQELIQKIEHAETACEKQLEVAKALPSAYLREAFDRKEAKKWWKRKLGEIFDVKQGVAMSPRRRQGVSPYPFLRTLNVLWGRIDLSTLDEMDFNKEEVNKLSLKSGDLLICEGGEVGRTAIWRGELEVCLYQNHIHRLRGINENLVPEFYMYWMHAAFKVFHSYIGQASDTTISNLSGNRLKSFLVPKPPLKTQKYIVTKLKEKMTYIDKLQTSIEKQFEAINVLPQLILRKAFRGEL